METRHKFYKQIYDWELEIHNDDRVCVMNCLRSKLGTCKESFIIVDLKDPPNWKTKAAIIVSTLTTKIFARGKFVTPIIRMAAVILDLIKDYLLFSYMLAAILYQEEGFRSVQDYIIIVISGLVLIQAHIVIGFYSYLNRYEIFILRRHETPTMLRIIFTVVCMLLLPILFALMSAERHIEQHEHDGIFNDLDENELKFEKFQEILKSRNALRRKKCSGQVTIKTLEGCLESYWQILILTILYCQPNYDGILNRSIIGLDLILDDPERATFFIFTYILSFITYTFGIVNQS